MSVGLTRARGAQGFEGDPAGANPSVGGHEHQRVRSSARSALLAGGRGTGGVADDESPLEALTGVLVFPADGGGTHHAGRPGFDQTSSSRHDRTRDQRLQMSASSIALVPSGSLRQGCECFGVRRPDTGTPRAVSRTVPTAEGYNRLHERLRRNAIAWCWALAIRPAESRSEPVRTGQASRCGQDHGVGLRA